jgi:N-acetylmuramic acid 6-phosphate (MurNAc-6-P) etherase
MVLPTHTITLTSEQVQALHQSLEDMRHSINNQLSVVVAAVDVVTKTPGIDGRIILLLEGHSGKIAEEVSSFFVEFERALGITRDP